jgi:hypothetical protein
MHSQIVMDVSGDTRHQFSPFRAWGATPGEEYAPAIADGVPISGRIIGSDGWGRIDRRLRPRARDPARRAGPRARRALARAR